MTARLAGGLVMLLAACGPTHADCGDATCFGDDGPCLGEARLYETDLAPRHLVAGDVDGDGTIDVVAIGDANTGAVVAEVHRGLGDGTFAAPQPTTATGCSAYPLGADLDADGRHDLVYPDCLGNVLVFWGGQDGEPSLVTLPMILTTSAVTDANGDGHQDLVAFGIGTDADALPVMTLVRGLGGRAFEVQPTVALAAGGGPSGVRIGDVDGDGNADAVTWSAGVVDSIAVHRGDGNGGFAPPTPRAATVAAGHITVGDLAPGGGDELVISAPTQQGLFVGSGEGTDMTSVAPYRPAFSTIATFAGAASPAALVVDGFEPEVRYYVVDADGAPHEQGRLATTHAAQWLAAPDLDDDGAADLLVGHLARGGFSVWLSSESP